MESVNAPQIDWTPDAWALKYPLLEAVRQRCDIAQVACLLRLQADPNATNSGTCVLNMAIQNVASQSLNGLEVVKLLLQSGANPNSSALHLAIRHNLFDVVVELKKAGAKLDARIEEGTSPLHLVAGHMNTRLANELWPEDTKLSLSELDKSGNTALHCAAQAGSVEMLQWLVARGAQITVENAHKQTVLHLAAQNDHKQFAEAVLHGMGGLHLLDSADNKGNTALHLAAQAGWIDVVTWLLEMGASLSMNQAGKRPRDLLADVKSELDLLTAYDKTQAMLKAKEDSVMLQQGPIGELLLKQHRIIEAQQARLEQQERDLRQLKDRASAETLLEHMSNREYKEAEALIQDNPALLWTKSRVTDLSNSFTDITPLQYAMLTLDWSMWRTILRYLPSEEADRQYRDLETTHSGELDWQSIKVAISTNVKTGNAVRESGLLSGPLNRVWQLIHAFPFPLAPFIASVAIEDGEHVITYTNGSQERVLIRARKLKQTHGLLRYDVLDGQGQVKCNRSLRLLPAYKRKQVLAQYSSEYFKAISLDDLVEEQQQGRRFIGVLQSLLCELWDCFDCFDTKVSQCQECHKQIASKGIAWTEVKFDWAKAKSAPRVVSEAFNLAGRSCCLHLHPECATFVGAYIYMLDLPEAAALKSEIFLSIRCPTGESKVRSAEHVFRKTSPSRGFSDLLLRSMVKSGYLSSGQLTVAVGLKLDT